MLRRVFFWSVSAGLILAGWLSGCSPRRAVGEWVLRRPEPVRFGCPSAAGEATSFRLPVRLMLNKVLAGPALTSFAGNLNQPPDSILVPFSDETPPIEVLEEDLRRILETTGTPPNGEVQQMNVTLQTAFVRRSFHVLKSSEMLGRVTFDVTIQGPQPGRTNWVQRISGEHTVQPTYITSRSVEEALSGAYCDALSQFRKAIRSAELQAALKP